MGPASISILLASLFSFLEFHLLCSRILGSQVHQIQDQVKELSKYSEELHTKHKSVKETESTTEECVRNMKATLIAVHRAKDNYKQRILGKYGEFI